VSAVVEGPDFATDRSAGMCPASAIQPARGRDAHNRRRHIGDISSARDKDGAKPGAIRSDRMTTTGAQTDRRPNERAPRGTARPNTKKLW
jgi:hypothetical protein